MQVGICTKYTHSEPTYAAIRLATELATQGAEVSLYNPWSLRELIDRNWDEHVLSAKVARFTDWARYQQCLIWTTVPHCEQLDWATQNKIRTIVLAIWHELDKESMASLRMADIVLSPTIACHAYLRRHGIEHSVHIPWDCGQPFCRKPQTHTPAAPAVLLPLWDGNARRHEATLVDIVSRALQQNTHASVTVAYNSSTIAPHSAHLFKQMRRLHPERLQLLRGVEPSQRFRLFQQHDLALIPSHYESLCLTQLQSIALGTPVVGFHITPVDEVLTDFNAVIVGCSQSQGFLQRNNPNYEELDAKLTTILQTPRQLRALQQSTPYTTFSRREAFQKSLRESVH